MIESDISLFIRTPTSEQQLLIFFFFFRMKCMLENVYRGLGNTPYLCNAFKSVDDYILGELRSGRRRNNK